MTSLGTLTVEELARVLFETDSGHDGYPPLHESMLWEDIIWRDGFYERAREIIRKLGGAA